MEVEKIIESVGKDGKKVLSNILNKNTGKYLEYKEVAGVTDQDVIDGKNPDLWDVYIKYKDGEYYIMSEYLDKDKLFLEKDSIAEVRAMSTSEILLLKIGYYKGVRVNGYYEKGDTPAPIEYFLSDTEDVDDGGSVLVVDSIKLRHDFIGSVNVKYFGAKGDGINDDTVSFKESFKYNNIFIPIGTYIISDTIRVKTQTTVSGVFHKTIIKFIKKDSVCFLANPRKEDSNVFNFGLFQNIRIEGLGGTSADKENNNQTGFDIQGFQSTFLNVDVYFMYIGMRIQGVCLDFRNCTVSSNIVGITLDDYERTETVTTFNTMIDIIKCNFQWNGKGLINFGFGQTLTNGRENTVRLNIESTVFESNTQGFDLRPHSCTIRNCWFELNTNRPKIHKLRVLVENPRYETGANDQSIEYETGVPQSSNFNRSVEIGNGNIKTRSYGFQRFQQNGAGEDLGKLSLTEGMNSHSYIQINDSSDNSSNIINNSTPLYSDVSKTVVKKPKNRIGVIRIRPDGVLHEHSFPNLVNTERLGEGSYKITLSNSTDCIVQMTVVSPTSEYGTSNQANTYYGTMDMKNTISVSDYSSYNLINRIFIKTYKRPYDGSSDGSNDVMNDTWIYLTIIY